MKKNLIYSSLLFAVLVVSCSKESGCNDPNALNYSTTAEESDGSCFYESDINSGTSVSTNEKILYPSDFIGSNGYYTASLDIYTVNDDDVVFIEWKCQNCQSFESLPRTYDDSFSLGILRDNSNLFKIELALYNTSQNVYDAPYYDLFFGATFRAYVISYQELSDNGIGIEEIDKIEVYVKG